MQSRYYLGLASVLLGLASLVLSNGGFEESWLYLGACLCLLGVALIMISKRKQRTGNPLPRSGPGPHREKHSRRHARQNNSRNSGDGGTDHEDAGGGDGD
jgi:hypothetical protein